VVRFLQGRQFRKTHYQLPVAPDKPQSPALRAWLWGLQVNFTLNEDKRLAKFLKRPLRVASKEREILLNTRNNSKLADLKMIEITFTQK
jgi:hypothetical protein